MMQELQESLVRFGADVFTPQTYNKERVDYAITTPTGEGLLPPNAAHYVNHTFVEDCSIAEVGWTFSF